MLCYHQRIYFNSCYDYFAYMEQLVNKKCIRSNLNCKYRSSLENDAVLIYETRKCLKIVYKYLCAEYFKFTNTL